jgi:ribosomal protein S18 acetylase RimI-like enzyme
MTTKLVIRSPSTDELETVRSVVQKVVDETYGGLWAPPPLIIDEGDWSRAQVAVVSRRIVGVMLTQGEWISDLWVLRESRGHGVGRRLLAFGESEISQRGFGTIRLRVVKSNASAVRFYVRNGWKAKREFKHEKLPIEMIEMTKSVGQS